MGMALIAFSGAYVGFYDVSPVVKDLTQKCLFVIGIILVIKTFNFTAIVGILRSGGDTKFCLLVDSLSVWLIGVPCAFLGSYFLHLPIYQTLILVSCEELVKLFLSGKRVASNKWVKTIII